MSFLGMDDEAVKLEMEAILATPEVTVLGIGNIILCDEGFGVRAAETLDAKYEFPDNVQILDGGTLGMELLRFITGTKKLLILDSINGGEAPGTIFRFEDKAVIEHFYDKLSAHEVGIQDVLAFLAVSGKAIPNVVVIGAQPYNLGAGVGLSPEMEKLLPVMADKAVAELKNWGIELKEKAEVKEVDLHTTTIG